MGSLRSFTFTSHGSTRGLAYGILINNDRVIPLLFLISRSKLIPDFALTIHFLHLIITSVYTGSLPLNLLWWGLMLASAALMISAGVWACRRREMAPISFGTVPAKKEGAGVNGTAEQGVPLMSGGGTGDLEMGNLSRGGNG
jgi:protein SYS1